MPASTLDTGQLHVYGVDSFELRRALYFAGRRAETRSGAAVRRRRRALLGGKGPRLMLIENYLISFSPLLAQGMGGFMKSPLFPLLLMFVVMYLLFWGPEKRKRSEVQTMQTELKKNDKIVTIGGIYGTVVNAGKDSPEVTIRVDENTRMRIRRDAIAQRLNDDAGDKKDDS